MSPAFLTLIPAGWLLVYNESVVIRSMPPVLRSTLSPHSPAELTAPALSVRAKNPPPATFTVPSTVTGSLTLTVPSTVSTPPPSSTVRLPAASSTDKLPAASSTVRLPLSSSTESVLSLSVTGTTPCSCTAICPLLSTFNSVTSSPSGGAAADSRPTTITPRNTPITSVTTQ